MNNLSNQNRADVCTAGFLSCMKPNKKKKPKEDSEGIIYLNDFLDLNIFSDNSGFTISPTTFKRRQSLLGLTRLHTFETHD